MKSHPFGHLADAAIVFALLLALLLGVEVRWIVLTMLVLEFFSHIAKAFTAVLDPLVSYVRERL